MAKTVTKNRTKAQLKKIIEKVDFISGAQRKEWLGLIETFNQVQINEVYEYFSKAVRDEGNFMLNLLVKSGMKKKYIEDVKQISRKFILEAKKKEVKYQKNKN